VFAAPQSIERLCCPFRALFGGRSGCLGLPVASLPTGSVQAIPFLRSRSASWVVPGLRVSSPFRGLPIPVRAEPCRAAPCCAEPSGFTPPQLAAPAYAPAVLLYGFSTRQNDHAPVTMGLIPLTQAEAATDPRGKGRKIGVMLPPAAR